MSEDGCSEQVWHEYQSDPCSRKAKVTRDGKDYCGQHDPDRVTKRRAAKAAQIKATEGLSVEKLESATLVQLPTVEALAEMIVAGLETAMKPPLFRLAPKPLAQHLHDALAAEQATGS